MTYKIGNLFTNNVCMAGIVSLVVASQANAFSAVTRSTTRIGSANNCSVEVSSGTSVGGFAIVRIQNISSNYVARSGGTHHASGGPNANPNFGGVVTPAILVNCGFTNISMLTQTGASGTWASDAFMGFSFRGLSGATGAVLSDYVFELNGATGTTVTARITPVGTAAAGSMSTALFQQSRANQLLNNQPDLIGIVNEDASNVFNLQAKNGAGAFDLSYSSDTGFWTMATGSYAKDGDSKTSYVFGALGAHISLNPNLSVGGMLEVDRTSFELGGAKMSGTGWLAGPYVVGKLPDQEIYFEGRALYGQTDNELESGVGGAILDDIKTERFLLQAKIQGKIKMGQLTLKPLIDASYTSDKREAYSNGSSSMNAVSILII